MKRHRWDFWVDLIIPVGGVLLLLFTLHSIFSDRRHAHEPNATSILRTKLHSSLTNNRFAEIPSASGLFGTAMCAAQGRPRAVSEPGYSRPQEEAPRYTQDESIANADGTIP